MRLFRRIGDIISANLNEVVERFEDPELGLKLAIREMEEAVDSAFDGAVKTVANEKLLARQRCLPIRAAAGPRIRTPAPSRAALRDLRQWSCYELAHARLQSKPVRRNRSPLG